jgi:threonine dehydrogenase-like Zn-dependent dehydrogenase
LADVERTKHTDIQAAEVAMKALVWHGTTDIRCDSVPDPRIEHERDAIIKVTSCAICGSDLHLYDHFMPGMKSGDVMGHETMGEVVEVGPSARKSLKVGDRVVIPFTKAGGAITINFEEESVVERLNELTGGKGPEKCIDAVGLEAHATGPVDSMYDPANIPSRISVPDYAHHGNFSEREQVVVRLK